MILTGPEIKKQVKLNRIHINPFLDDLINPNSYNYRLHEDLLEICDDVIDPHAFSHYKKIKIPSSGYILKPGHLYLGSTVEEMGSDYYVTSLIGRSSVGRLGLFLQITADLGHIGAKHCWTLELKVVQPLVVYPHMKIGQVSFWVMEGKTENLYKGKYAKYSIPHCSEIHNEFKQIQRKILMILSGDEITKQVISKNIVIDPFILDQVNPNSYNFRLGSSLRIYKNLVLDPKKENETVLIHIPEEGYVLKPNILYLGHTEEVMGSNLYVPIIRGRSSIGRLGLFVHITADLIDIGSINQWTLQMHAVQPVKIYPGMLIGQVTFWKVQGEIVLYNGKYQSSRGPMASKIYKDFPVTV